MAGLSATGTLAANAFLFGATTATTATQRVL